jgi:hypothetical protein
MKRRRLTAVHDAARSGHDSLRPDGHEGQLLAASPAYQHRDLAADRFGHQLPHAILPEEGPDSPRIRSTLLRRHWLEWEPGMADPRTRS